MPVPRLPRRVARRRVAGALVLLVGCLVCGPLAGVARASTNASSAAAFIESAQNRDGGFSASYGGASRSSGSSNPVASLWATVALLAAGKNPQDEALNDGASAQAYLTAHLSAFRSLTDVGLLAIIEAGSGADPALDGDPATALKTDLGAAAIRADPAGAALGALGLAALGDDTAARADATTLIADQAADGGWAEAGTDPSAATALVLQALAATGLAHTTRGASAVTRGLSYLHKAQINDGSIAQSVQSATTGSGDVAATAFTVQALAALHHVPLRTSTGVSVLAGLANYQQQSGNGQGGLSPYGAYDTGVAPSVIETAEAYPAFDGVSFPLPAVAVTPAPAVTTTPRPAAHTAPAPTVNRASTGRSAAGISAAGTGPKHSAAAFQGASAAGQTGARPRPRHKAIATSAGPTVSGAVVGTTPPPKLTSAAGRPPAPDHSALYLALGLAVVAVAGGLLELRRPRRRERSAVATGVARSDAALRWFARRGSLVPAAAALVGVALILVPVASSMWSRAPRGAALVRAFKPYMGEAHLARLRGEVSLMARAVAETRRLPTVKSFADEQWPGIDHHFAGTLRIVSAQRTHYETLAGLPSFSSFPWFLFVPGLALIGVAALALWRPALWRRGRWAVALIGVALVLAPLALGLFSAGGQGASLVTAFAPVETRANVTALQTGFTQLVLGESEVAGVATSRAGAHRYPAAAAFGKRYGAILTDFTPLLGVMSDNVPNYRAVAALPNLAWFPWLFAIPGLAAVLVALAGAARGLRVRRLRTAGLAHSSTHLSHPTNQGATDAT